MGVIGAGSIAAKAIPGFRRAPGVEVVAVSARRRERAAALAAANGIAGVHDDHHELIAREDVDLVYVATPPSTHHELVLDVLAAGRHVLCEKQFALNVGEAIEMRERAEEAGVVHATTHPSRYRPATLLVRRLIADGYLGVPQLVDVRVFADYALRPTSPTHYVGWATDRRSGGGLRDYLSHHLDHLRFIFGELTIAGQLTRIVKPTNVMLAPGVEFDAAVGSALETAGTAPANAYDTAVVHAKLASGALVSVASSWSLLHPSGLDWEMYGDAGMLRMTGPSFPAEVFGARADEAGPRPLLKAGPEPDPYTSLASDLRASVEDRTHVPTFATFDDGVELQRLLDAIVEP